MDVKLFNRWHLQLVKGIVFIVAGVLIFQFKAYKFLLIPVYVGIFFSIFGILDIFISFSHRNMNFSWQWLFAEGFQYLFVGFIFIIKRDMAQEYIELLLGMIAAFTGVTHFSAALNYKNAGVLGYRTITFNGVVCIFFAVLLIFSSQIEAIYKIDTLVVFIYYIIAEGFFTVLNTFFPRHVSYDYKQ